MREPGPAAAGDDQVDVYAGAAPEKVLAAAHRPSCTRNPCRCFGLATELRDHPGAALQVRILDGGEMVGKADLLAVDGMLVMGSSVVIRASATGDWRRHYPIVSEILLRETVRVADERGAVLTVPSGWPRHLLDELGFVPHGVLLRRDPGALARHALLRTPKTRSAGRYAAWCVCGEERRAGTLGAAHDAVFAHAAKANGGD
jgi:hypothetical protein